ncbi:DUF3426 domain-containing protein [uncultured Mailhella sp.]|uniref:DUF3426 domain-containing protein n=1 Tax=uncultured Mailhella sp. TaxID=1981031 RepID=UPI002637C569|nr:DUF3426 domain-containing protein [uncultured Mailhella sp.]
MNVTCPQCGTVYRLPEGAAKPGAKLRCSVCRHIFLLPEIQEGDGFGGGLSLDAASSPIMKEQRGNGELASALGNVPGGDGGLSLAGGGETVRDSTRSASVSSGPLLPENGLDLAIGANAPAEEGRQGLHLDGETHPSGGLEMPQSRKPRFQGLFTMLLCVIMVAGGWWMWENTPYLDGFKQLISPYTNGEKLNTEAASPVAGLDLKDVRQYSVQNKKIGSLIVIEGKVHNGASSARSFIRVEASLCNNRKEVLASQKQLAGTSMSPFQLEVLDREELENALNSRLDIVSANMNVQPGSEVPFIVVFTDVPQGASDYNVSIVEAEITGKPGNLTE